MLEAFAGSAFHRILDAVVSKLNLRSTDSSWAICVVAFAVRLAFVADQAHKIPAQVLATVPFQNEVGNIAAALVTGSGFCCVFHQPTGPTAWLAPVYPLVLAAIFKLFGAFTLNAFYAAAVLNCLFSALACLPLYLAGRRIGGTVAGVCGAWLWAFFPSGILMPFEWIWDTSLSALLAATLLWATLTADEKWNRSSALLYGLTWGIALLTNPALALMFPFALGWIVYRRLKVPSAVRNAGVALGVVVACCLPWTVRNAVQFHRLIPVRSNFAFELWLGNNEIFDEHSRELNRITRFEQVRRYAQLGEMGFVDEKWAQAQAFVRTHTGLALRLTGKRVIATWLGTETPWQDFRRADSWLIRFLFFWNLVTLVGTAVGLARLLRAGSPFFLPVAVFPLIFPLTYYITHTSLRYRHPVDPALALLLAIAVFGIPPDATDAGR